MTYHQEECVYVDGEFIGVVWWHTTSIRPDDYLKVDLLRMGTDVHKRAV